MVKKLCFLIIFLSILLSISLISASNIGLIENSTWQSNLTAVKHPATVFGDIDNDGDLDLAVIGCFSDGANDCENGVSTKIYINNGSTLTENSTWQQNLTVVGVGSLAFVDIDNDGDLDLALSGCDSSVSYSCNGNSFTKIYINNGTTLTENSQWQVNLSAFYDSSMTFGDVDNDGKLDLVINGVITVRTTKVYLNNGTSLIENSVWQSELKDIKEGQVVLGDVDNDGDLDLALTGDPTDSSSFISIYINNGTSFVESSQWKNNLVTMTTSSLIFGDYNNDGKLDLMSCGLAGGDYCYLYKNNGSTFLLNQSRDDSLLGIFRASIAFGDYDNDGDLDFFGAGREEGRARTLENNETNNYYFQNDVLAHANISDYITGGSSLSWVDIDNDMDLDLLVIGLDYNDGLISKIYINNNTVANTQSTPPNTFSSSYLDGVLNLTWNTGGDSETPVLGLYYNLMVGNSTDNNTVVSGVYGGSSGGGGGSGGGANGYFGNMMQRKNMSFNKYLSDDTYYWYVQTIDTGLRKSNWSARQSIVIGADVSAPNISSVSSSVTYSTATITWTTNESANSTVYYGITNATTSSSSLDDLVISHSIGLTGLSASTLYYYNVSSCDYWNNCNTSIQYNFTTSAAPTNGGSPGGGSSSTTPTIITPTIPEFDIDFSTSDSGIFEVTQGDIKTFSFQGEVEHYITVMAVTSNSMTLLITSDPITIQVLLGETIQIDMNNDEINDLEIKLNSITNSKANFLITKLEGADIAGEEELGKEPLFDVKISLSNLFQIVKTGREIIAQIEVFNVNNIGQVDVIVDYYITDLENNTLAQGSDTLAVEAVASFVRTLIVPYNLKSGKYLFNVDISYGGEIMASGNVEFRVIKSYWIIIAIGLVVLIVAGIFFYLWRIKRREEKDVGMLKRQISKLKNKEGWRKKIIKRRKRRKHGRSKNR